jgi:hypothetical protein
MDTDTGIYRSGTQAGKQTPAGIEPGTWTWKWNSDRGETMRKPGIKPGTSAFAKAVLNVGCSHT